MKKKANPKNLKTKTAKPSTDIKTLLLNRVWKQRGYFGKTLLILSSLVALFIASSYGVAVWYEQKHAHIPLTFGATFVPNYARYFELDPEETMQAMIDDLGVRRFRLVSYWKDIERVPGEYDFRELDWQFQKVEKAEGKIALAIGLRQPRWPECHGPQWAMDKPMIEWEEDLNDFMGAVIDRYKDSPALVEYQLENEFFLSVFGECPDFTRERLVREFDFVKMRDPDTPVTISRSNNALGIPIGQPQPDQFAVSVYKRVWDKTLTKRYYEYPFPAWFYGSLAGWGKIFTGKDLYIHELQTEAWLPTGYSMRNAPIEELYKSLNPERLKSRMEYGVGSGMKTIDLWGAEWWYHMKTKRGAPELWETAKSEIQRHNR